MTGWDRASGGGSSRLARARTLYFVAATVLAALVPLILLAGLWIRSEFAEDQQELESYLSGQAASLSARVDAEIRQQLSVLQAIAALPSLDEPNLAYFHVAATRMVAAMPQWAAIGLIDPATGRQVLNTLRPVGSELPDPIAPEVVRHVVETRRPAIHTRYAGSGGLYTDPAVLLYTPVSRQDAAPFVLVAAMKAAVIQQLVHGPDPRLLKVIVDERGRILGRSRQLEEFIGQEANLSLRQNTDGHSSGAFVASTLDHQDVFTAFQRSPLTNWLAVAAADRAALDAVTGRTTWTMLAAGALSLTLAGVLAVFLFESVMQRRLSDERLASSRALSDLDARLLAATQGALAEQRKAAVERDVLLREIYHRVKNNLQIIQSLLRLGARDLSPVQREPFEMAVRRIGAMARVHTLLYNSPDLASIDFKDYLEEVVRETADAFGASQRGIRTELEAEPMRVPLDIAIPLAFIVVELLTNAFKHAFPDGRPGLITVAASQSGEQGVLTIEDNGVGLPELQGRRRSLGLNLVGKLVDQINGTLEPPEAGMSVYRLTFPLTVSQAGPLPGSPAS